MNYSRFGVRSTIVWMARPDESVVDAAQRMHSHDARVLVVVEEIDGDVYPVGLLAEEQLDRAIDAPAVEAQTVRDVMTPDVPTILDDEDPSPILTRVVALGMRAVPVVDQEGCLSGLLNLG